jgi:hypothetical protein
MSRLITRRNFLRTSAIAGSGLILAGCDQFDFLADKAGPGRQIMERANVLTYQAQRLIIGDQALAREYAPTEIRQGQRPNGSTDPTTDEYVALRDSNFAGYTLKIIWEHMRDIGRIPFRYETFLKYVRQHITNAPPGSMSHGSAK